MSVTGSPHLPAIPTIDDCVDPNTCEPDCPHRQFITAYARAGMPNQGYKHEEQLFMTP